MRRWKLLPRRQGRALDGPHQAPDRHGAARGLGRRLRRRRRDLAGRADVVRAALCDQRADDVRGRWRRAITPIACAMLSDADAGACAWVTTSRAAQRISRSRCCLRSARRSAIRDRRRPASTPSRSSACSPTISRRARSTGTRSSIRWREANLNWLRRFATNLTDDKILARVVESPLDLERRNPHNWQAPAMAAHRTPAQSAAHAAGARLGAASHADPGSLPDRVDHSSRRLDFRRTRAEMPLP